LDPWRVDEKTWAQRDSIEKTSEISPEKDTIENLFLLFFAAV